MRVLSVVWALSPLLFGIPAAPAFAWAASRLHSRWLAVSAAGYAIATVAFVAMSAQPPSSEANRLAGVVGLAVMVGATTHAIIIRRRVFDHVGTAARQRDAVSGWTGALAPSSVPAPSLATSWWAGRPLDPVAGERSSADCTRFDTHRLGMGVRAASRLTVAGACLIALDFVLRLHGTMIGVGGGLLLAGCLGLLFGRSVDGPVLTYFSWGVPRVMRLDTVTQVTTRGATMVRLTASGLAKPVSVPVSALSPRANAGREHLREWLNRSGVQVSPKAASLLRTGATRPIVALSGRRRALVLIFVLGAPLFVLAEAGWLVSGTPARFANAAASNRIQAAPTQLARVETVTGLGTSSSACGCYSAYQVRLVADGAVSVVHVRGRPAIGLGQLVGVRVDPRHPEIAEFPGLPYYTPRSAITLLVGGVLAGAIGLLGGFTSALTYRRLRPARSPAR